MFISLLFHDGCGDAFSEFPTLFPVPNIEPVTWKAWEKYLLLTEFAHEAKCEFSRALIGKRVWACMPRTLAQCEGPRKQGADRKQQSASPDDPRLLPFCYSSSLSFPVSLRLPSFLSQIPGSSFIWHLGRKGLTKVLIQTRLKWQPVRPPGTFFSREIWVNNVCVCLCVYSWASLIA